jgi:hypothetical protein
VIQRPYPPLTEEQAFEVLQSLRLCGDKLLVRMLLDFDYGTPEGAFPSHQTLSLRTGWSAKTVRNRILKLRQAGIITARRGGTGGLMRYYVVPPGWTPRPDSNGAEQDLPVNKPAGTSEVRDVPHDVPHDVPPGRAKDRDREVTTAGETGGDAGRVVVPSHPHPRTPYKQRTAQRPRRTSRQSVSDPYLSPADLDRWEEESRAS